MEKIRVLRIMEYEFSSYEAYATHQMHSAVPFDGEKDYGLGRIRSTTIVSPFSVFRNENPTEGEAASGS